MLSKFFHEHGKKEVILSPGLKHIEVKTAPRVVDDARNSLHK
jgi:hypothetical protein